ncbi:glycoside hydrolase superfamily [Astrocystis sublimbata]|nr:glycoside hydrolase superfamily [Astrocystis sublimbata]
MGTRGHRYSFGSDQGEHAPLDHPLPSTRRNPVPNRHRYDLDTPVDVQQPQQYRDHPSNNNPPAHSAHPGAHPDSAFARLRQNRAHAGVAQEPEYPASGAAPIPPLHRTEAERTWGHESQPNSITPGADNFSEAASGGIPGLAMSVADRQARESGLEAMRGSQPSYQQQQQPQQQPPQVYQRSQYTDAQPGMYEQNRRSYQQGQGSSPSLAPSLAPVTSGSTPTRSLNSFQSDPFRDPHLAYGQRMDPRLGQFNPNDIDDDGDDGLDYRRSARASGLSIGNSSGRGGNGSAAGAAGAAGAGGVLGGILGKNRNSAIAYDPVANPSTAYQGASPGEYELGTRPEKSEWIAKQSSSRKKWTWIIAVIVVLVIAGAVVGGVLGSKLGNNGGGGGSSGGQSADADAAKNGDLDLNSDEIQALLNNPNLHKVFPGVDYTPINVQYPDCLKNPPSQNNVTRDVAILSQLTNTIRLYGTDCNQTEMTIHAIRQLKKEDDIKIWLGVWQDDNKKTNDRQLDRMWEILDQYGDKPFKGLIVGNEILFREQMTATELGTLLDDVRTNLSNHNWDLPVATSDLGDNWDYNLAQVSDYIMGNVHPFFAGQDSKVAASWTWTFWHNKAGSFFKTDNEKNVISEIGWPTKGGTDCGEAETCTDGAVAGIDELNTLLDSWVCQALSNGTNYFWFEMFDEPWKESFNAPGKEWEDQWGILDVNRNLKKGVKIPDCGGKTI